MLSSESGIGSLAFRSSVRDLPTAPEATRASTAGNNAL